MPEKIANIAKNTSYFTFALILQKIISFTYFTLIARALGPEDLGKYYFAISFTSILAILIDLGFGNILTRETARLHKSAADEAEEKRKINELLGNVIAVKIPLTVLTLALVAVLMYFLDYPEIIRRLIYISSVSMVLDSFTLIFFSVIRGFHNLFFESISSVIFQLIILTAGIITLRLDRGLLWLMTAVAAASIFNFLYSALLCHRKWKIKIWPQFDWPFAKWIINLTIPFALYGIFQRVYTYFDSVLLAHLAGDKFVGLYQVPFKIVTALQFLPMAFTASLYPAMSAYWIKNREQLAVTFERAMNYLTIISLPIAIGLAITADKIVLIFKSDFSGAILPLELTMGSLLFIFLNFPVGSLLNACDKQKVNTFNMGLVMILSIILNFLLIPKYQAVGASLTALVTSFLMLALGLYQVPKIIDCRFGRMLKVFFKALLASLLMALMAFYLKNYLNIFPVIALSGLAYFVSLFFLKGFSRTDALSVWQSLKREKS